MINDTINNADLNPTELVSSKIIHYQQSAELLVKATIDSGAGVLNNSGALVVKTGKFTGRSPKDKYIVVDSYTKEKVDWNDFNNPIDESAFDLIHARLLHYIKDKEIWVRDASVGADDVYNTQIRITTDTPWANLFALNMFLRPGAEQLEAAEPEWHIYHIESFKAIPGRENVRSENFSIINFSKKVILIGGTGYTGEIKKGMSRF